MLGWVLGWGVARVVARVWLLRVAGGGWGQTQSLYSGSQTYLWARKNKTALATVPARGVDVGQGCVSTAVLALPLQHRPHAI